MPATNPSKPATFAMILTCGPYGWMTDPASASQLRYFGAMADTTRLRIIDALSQEELCVCDLCAVVGLSHSRLSFNSDTARPPPCEVSPVRQAVLLPLDEAYPKRSCDGLEQRFGGAVKQQWSASGKERT